MSIASYSDLQSAVASWLNRSDLTSNITDFISLGEDRIYRDLRIRAMETAWSDTLATGTVAVPNTYLELVHAYIDGSPVIPLQRVTAEVLYQKYPLRSSTGQPIFIARDAQNFIFGPYPDSNYSVIGTYYCRLPALSSTNTTNWFTANAPSILLWASLLEAEPFIMNDERLAVWQAKYDQIKENITVEDDREKRSGSPLRAVVSWS